MNNSQIPYGYNNYNSYNNYNNEINELNKKINILTERINRLENIIQVPPMNGDTNYRTNNYML